jgi:hypothetical protein
MDVSQETNNFCKFSLSVTAIVTGLSSYSNIMLTSGFMYLGLVQLIQHIIMSSEATSPHFHRVVQGSPWRACRGLCSDFKCEVQ